MRITTSYFSAQSYLTTEFDALWSEFLAHLGKEADPAKVAWHWLLTEKEVNHIPKSWTSMAKTDPRQYLATGLSKGFLRLRLSMKAEHGKVWHSDSLSMKVHPEEVVRAIAKKAAPGSGAKWSGPSVDIFMPMHQKHPGLAEHALLGAFETERGEVVWFLSDRPDPWAAALWHAYELNPAKRLAITRFSVLDRQGQKGFNDTEDGELFEFREFKGRKLSLDELEQALAGVKRFAWRTDAAGGSGSIPLNARKFKLGEEITEQERRATPAEATINALASAHRR